jgi:hypothetical protein
MFWWIIDWYKIIDKRDDEIKKLNLQILELQIKLDSIKYILD